MSRIAIVFGFAILLCSGAVHASTTDKAPNGATTGELVRLSEKGGWLALRDNNDNRRPGDYDDRGRDDRGRDDRGRDDRGRRDYRRGPGRYHRGPRRSRLGWKERDGLRFRGGIAGSFGGQLVESFGFWMGGVDGRLGIQINHLFAVYAQAHLSIGAGNAGITGTFAATMLGEVTFFDRLFVGAGVGYGVLNNPQGAVLHLRFGGYPAMGRSAFGARRKGLMMGVDTRVFIAGGFTAFQVIGSIGYEAF